MSNPRTQSLVGMRFGKLYVESQSVEIYNGRRQSVCRCRCDCGNITTVPASKLQKKDGTAPSVPTKSCGCTRRIGNISGQRFGRLVAIEDTGSDPNGKNGTIWRCHCDCGNEIIVPATFLKSGLYKSCGCLRDEAQQRFAKNARKYAEKAALASHTPEVEAARVKTRFGEPGSEARSEWGRRLRETLKEKGIITEEANIAIISKGEPAATNPYRGVCWNTAKKCWMAYCQVAGKKWQKAFFKTPEEAKAARDAKQREMLEMYGVTDAVEKLKAERGYKK